MELPILDEPCSQCNGPKQAGDSAEASATIPLGCRECAQTGHIPTQAGYAVLSFLHRHSRLTPHELYDQLAAIEHQRWSEWALNVLTVVGVQNPDGSVTLPADRVERWLGQAITPFGELLPAEQDQDRAQVDRYWPLIVPLLLAAR